MIEKGYKEGTSAALAEYNQPISPPGYPEAEWDELRESANAAYDRLGAVLRDLIGPKA